jgi:hypothetical protein
MNIKDILQVYPRFIMLRKIINFYAIIIIIKND